jgi:uncharacterized protein YqcC (DUF446 family)
VHTSSSDRRVQELLDSLDGIERELRRLGWWDTSLDVRSVRERAAAIVSESGESPVMHMPFETWLQAVFLPNAREAAANRTLPESSQVSLMAMRVYDYHTVVPEAKELLRLLREFDALVESES